MYAASSGSYKSLLKKCCEPSKVFGPSIRNFFSKPQSKDCIIWRKMALGLKLVYRFINFIIPLPATHIRISWGFPMHGSQDQNYWVAPKSTQPFIIPRSIKWVPEILGYLAVKSKLSPCSGTVALRQLNQSIKRGHKVLKKL